MFNLSLKLYTTYTVCVFMCTLLYMHPSVFDQNLKFWIVCFRNQVDYPDCGPGLSGCHHHCDHCCVCVQTQSQVSLDCICFSTFVCIWLCVMTFARFRMLLLHTAVRNLHGWRVVCTGLAGHTCLMCHVFLLSAGKRNSKRIISALNQQVRTFK